MVGDLVDGSSRGAVSGTTSGTVRQIVGVPVGFAGGTTNAGIQRIKLFFFAILVTVTLSIGRVVLGVARSFGMTFVVPRTGHGTVLCTRGNGQTVQDVSVISVSIHFGVVRVLAFGALLFRFVVGLTLAGDCLDLRLFVDDAGAMAVATHLVVRGRGGAVRVARQLTPTAPPIVLTSFTISPAIVTGGVVVVQADAHGIRAVVVGIARAVAVASVFVDTTAIKGGPRTITDTHGQGTVLVRDGVDVAITMSTAR